MADESEMGQMMASGAWRGSAPAARITPLRVRKARLSWLSTHGDPIQASFIGYKLDNQGNRLAPPPPEPKAKPKPKAKPTVREPLQTSRRWFLSP